MSRLPGRNKFSESVQVPGFLRRFLLSNPRVAVIVALLTCVPMGLWSAQLFGDVRADLRELLPTGARSVETLHELERRFGGWSQLSIVVESPSREANSRFSDDLVSGLVQIPSVRSARNKVGPEKAFFEKRWWLYVDLADLEEIQSRIDEAATRARKQANPLLVELDDEDAAPEKLDFSDITQKYEAQKSLVDRFPEDYFESQDGKMLAVIVRRRGLAFGLVENEQLVDAAQAAIARLSPTTYHPEMIVGVGGDVKNVLEEHTSLVEDLVTATVICTVLLGVVVIGYYRRTRSLYLIFVPLLVGTLWTFGISHFAIGYLNASSAFLGAIVPGNGINFGLIMLARYIEERRGGLEVQASLDRAVRYTFQGTSTAALAASVAYGSLFATDFLGFKHFGVIGGIGMVLCWLATFAVMPPLILWSERRSPIHTQKELRLPLPAPGAAVAFPARIVSQNPRAFALSGMALTLAATLITLAFLRDPLEKDFQKLRNTASLTRGAGYWEKKVDQIFNRYLAPQVVLADDAADVPHIVAQLKKVIDQEGDKSPISDVTALTTLVPSEQEEKIAVLREIRELLTDDVVANLEEDQKKLALQYRPPADLEPFEASDLPEGIRQDFRELDGTEGRVVLVLPNLKLNLYHSDEIKRVGDLLRSLRLPDGKVVESSGSFVIYTDMLRAVEIDGPKATLYSFAGVLIVCVLVYRRPRRLLIVCGSLLAGVAWMGAVLALTDMKINFLNFIALPLTFGIGVDYAVNIFSRGLIEANDKEPAEAARRAVVATGGAVILCSLTTIIGYGSLLVANNGALISFGKVAILGEFTCLAAAIFVMPALMILFAKPRPRKDTAST